MTTKRPSRRNLPADATKTALADAAALRAIVSARRNGQPLTRLRLAEAMQAVFFSPRYENVPHPAWATVVKSVKRQAQWDRDIVVRLSATDPENRI
ncbi:MAG: hypothetical protein HOY78_02470 [Saccharothrix sp.]|nr:hypothetical protein [Saccharothrix sp.]